MNLLFGLLLPLSTAIFFIAGWFLVGTQLRPYIPEKYHQHINPAGAVMGILIALVIGMNTLQTYGPRNQVSSHVPSAPVKQNVETTGDIFDSPDQWGKFEKAIDEHQAWQEDSAKSP